MLPCHQERDKLFRQAKNIFKAEKLIKISLEYEEDSNQENIRTISSIRITGDFFLYPEDSLEKLEEHLRGTKLEKVKLKEKIKDCLNNSQAFGFNPDSMSEAILGCIRDQH